MKWRRRTVLCIVWMEHFDDFICPHRIADAAAGAASAPASHHFVFTFHQIIIIIINRHIYLDICLITTVERSIDCYTE